MTEFEKRVAKCSTSTRELLAFLRTVAQHAGKDVDHPTFDGGKGEGVTYRRAGKPFCRFDPKHQADHVWALVVGGDRKALSAAGEVSDREDGPWVVIRDMRGAVRLVPEILRAYGQIEQ